MGGGDGREGWLEVVLVLFFSLLVILRLRKAPLVVGLTPSFPPLSRLLLVDGLRVVECVVCRRRPGRFILSCHVLSSVFWLFVSCCCGLLGKAGLSLYLCLPLSLVPKLP